MQEYGLILVGMVTREKDMLLRTVRENWPIFAFLLAIAAGVGRIATLTESNNIALAALPVIERRLDVNEGSTREILVELRAVTRFINRTGTNVPPLLRKPRFDK